MCEYSAGKSTYRDPKINCIKMDGCKTGGMIYLSHYRGPFQIRLQNVETLPEGFLKCNKLHDLELTSVEKIGTECFMGSKFKNMGSVVSLIERLEKIPKGAFYITKDLKGNKMAVSIAKMPVHRIASIYAVNVWMNQRVRLQRWGR